MANKVAHFNNGRITVAGADASCNVGVADFSFSFWGKLGGLGGGVCSKCDGAALNGYDLAISNGTLQLNIYMDIGGARWSYPIDITAFVSAWHYYCLVKTAAGVAFYIDGNLQTLCFAPIKSGNPSGTTAGTSLLLGQGIDTAFMSGDLDDFRIYKKALSDADRTAIYAGGAGCKYDVGQAGAASFVLQFDGDAVTTIPTGPTLTGTIFGGITYPDGGVPFWTMPDAPAVVAHEEQGGWGF